MTSAPSERSTSEDEGVRRSEALNANYRTESNLAARQSIFQYSTRPSGQPSLLDLIHDPSAGPLLDVGCGNGLWLDLLGKRGPLPETVLGLDRSRGMLAAASARIGTAVQFVEGDATALPVRDEVSHTSLCLWVLYHVQDKRRALEELRRTLRPGGKVYVSTNDAAFAPVFDDFVPPALEAATGSSVSQWLEPLDFNVTNGLDIVSPHFDRVSSHFMHQDFAVPEVDPLLHYVNSARAPIEAEVGLVPWDSFMTVLRQRLQHRLDLGPISYRTTQVVYECW